MKHLGFDELIDIDELQSLCEQFTRMTGFGTAFLDMEGNVLVATGWQEVCSRFHRSSPVSSVKCRESDTVLASRLREGEEFCMYRCGNGLTDVAVPIVIEGKQVGRLYSGQVLLEPPDMDFFRAQAAECGFDESSYLAAVRKVPVVTEERVRLVVGFLCRLAKMIGETELANRRAKEAGLMAEESPAVLFRWKAAEGWPVVYVSNNVIQFGYGPEELLSGAISCSALVWPEDIQRIAMEIRQYLFRGVDRFRLEHRIITREGDIRWVNDRIVVERDADETVAHYRGVILDITERKRAEDALRFTQFAVDHASSQAFWTTPEGRIIYVNDAACRALGYRREELLEMSVLDVRPTFSVAMFAEFWRELKTKKFLTFETWHRARDGRVYPVEINANHVVFDGKEYNCTFATDISERKRMEEELMKAQKLESVGLLAGGMAHDFNNLLTSILGNISLVKMLLPPQEKTYERLCDAERASLRAKDLTNQFLTFAKGGLPLKRTISAAEVVRSCARLALSGFRATCECFMPDDLRFIDADEGQISQVINNLVVNAVQAMGGEGRITIQCDNVAIGEHNKLPLKNGCYVSISVKDQGVGIPEESLHKIFDPYFTTKEHGRGLGLASSYLVVRNHGGHITVESTVGAGTTFTVYLPAVDSPHAAAEHGEPQTVTGTGRVLIMDDEELVREVVGEMLGHLGYEVGGASDGAEAIEAYMNAMNTGHPFDVVIMDLTIPGGMGGREAIRRLKELAPDVRGIVSSGYSNDPVMSNFTAYGFSGVIQKPYQMRALVEEIRKVLKK